MSTRPRARALHPPGSSPGRAVTAVGRARRTWAGLLAAALVTGLLAAAGTGASAAVGDEHTAPVDPVVSAALAAKGSSDLWVVLEDSANLTAASGVQDWADRGAAVVAALQKTAEASQREVRQTLGAADADFTPYWVSNRVLVRGSDTALTARLATLDGVERLAATQTLELPETAEPAGDSTVQAVEWGIDAINADDAWAEFGVRGEGLVVANIDSGVQYDHPALADSYRGNDGGGFDHDHNWFDPSRTCGAPTAPPCDNNGHGTHTMGTMVGEAGANQIGVAPAARWIAAKGCETNGCSDASLLASGQWVLAPTDTAGNDPRPDLRPHVVNNSWGAGNGPVVDPWYDEVIQAWTASGIFGVFSNGNEGPGCDTTGSPADSVHAFGVGGFQSNGGVYTSSSRGPGQPGVIRPNISAPAVNVRSALPGNGYGTASGTSMAAPHVSGTVALMWAAAPALVGDVAGTRELLGQTAVDTEDTSCGGTAENNNVWGEGKLDALASVSASPRGETGTLTGTVTDSTTGAPLEGADVSVTGAASRATSTDADGTYTLRLPIGDYTVTAGLFGYSAATTTATVRTDATTTADLALAPVPSHSVSGTVTDARGRPLAGATVTLAGTPVPPATTGPDGRYAFGSVPEGTYDLTAVGSSCTVPQTRQVVVDGDEVVDLTLTDRTDAYGYRCAPEDSDYLEATTPLALSGDDASVPLDLPFPFTFYGQTYQQAFVATNGYLNFLAPDAAYSNSSLPSASAPNAAVYALWDDLQVDAQARVLWSTGGTAPNRWVVVEWRDVSFLGSPTWRLDTEVVLHENGEVVTAWRGIDPAQPREAGSSATVGIEDESGTVGLEYSFDTPRLTDDTAVRFSLPPNAYVQGTVTDANDGLPVAGAVVRATQDGTEVRTATTGPDGTYRMQLELGTYTVTAEAARYGTASRQVVLESEQEVVTADFTLTTARGEVSPESLRWVLPQGAQRQASLTLSNTGSGPLTFEVAELGGQRRAGVEAEPKAAALTGADEKVTTARDARARFTERSGAAAVPMAPGDVLTSWPAAGASVPWGVGSSTDVWVSDADAGRNIEYQPDGTPTGRSWPAGWGAGWVADMALDSRAGAMCQVAVGGDNGIHCWDEATGQVQYSLTGPWSAVSQRGLAYRPDDDTFYVGGWTQEVVYHVAGASHDDPGAVLGQCGSPAGLAGLAWNPTAGVLWATTNSPTNTIYQLAPDDCEVVSTLGFPETTQYAGAGLDMDGAGNLWAVSQTSGTVYLLDSGVPHATDVPWLTVAPSSGEVAAGGSTTLTVSVDTTGLEPGVYDAQVLITTNAGRQPRVTVPVELVVSGYWVGVNAGGGEYTDTSGIRWSADQEHSAGSYGWTGRSTVAAERGIEIAGTQDDPLYRDQRQGMDTYTFDGLPAGTYEVTLDFAELLTAPRTDWRLFDVRVDGQWALVGYDIAAEVGGRTADRRTFTAEVGQDGSLVVDFVDRRGYRPSVVNAVQVVHRPDL